MSKETKKSILEDAANDLKAILETADLNAKQKLAKELPLKFDALLKEELKKISNSKSQNESASVDKNKESVKDKKDKINESVTDMREMSLEEIEGAFDNASLDDEFMVSDEENTDDMEITMSDIEKELAQMEGMANEMEDANNNDNGVENAEEEEVSDDPFTMLKSLYDQFGEMIKKMEDKKMQEEYGTEFDSQMSTIYGEEFKDSLGDDKYKELYEMFVSRKKGDPFKSSSVNESEGEPFEDKSNPSKEQGKSIAELHDKGPTPDVVKKMHKGDLGTETIKEVDETEKDHEEDEMDEAHGHMLAQNKKTGAEVQPRPEFADYKKNRYRLALQKEGYDKKIKGLIEENKKITKDLNEHKKGIDKASKLVENYKSVLGKYRDQLTEMAVFNSNLANVNNILLNEDLALTTTQKVEIINKFKNVNSISESEKLYKTVISEMKDNKKTLVESVEQKVSSVVEPSNKNLIEEAVVKTAYDKNDSISRIKERINKIENR